MTETYGIPADYRINPVNITMDEGGSYYWDPSRVKKSRAHQYAVYQWAAQLIKQKKFQTIFDVGCGFAAKLAVLHQRFPERRFFGIDQPNAINLCKEHYSFGEWLGVDFEKNPATPPVLADLSISSDVIEHLANPDVLLDYLKKVTKPEGYILISTPDRASLRGADCRTSPNAYHVREWTYDEFSQYLTSRGFKIIDHRLLPAIKCEASGLYLKKVIRRALCGQGMRYNQAILLQQI